jgi:Tfp pilus assembly protein PilO
MTLTDRDRKIAMVLAPLVLLAGYWFFVISPKREEAAKLGERLTQSQEARDTAQSQLGQLEGSKTSYAKDYETVVRLGKAIPATLDMPSLLVQLESASKGTGINFSRVRAGARSAAPAAPAPASGAPGQGGDAAAGGEPASTGPGNATEQANDAAKTSDSASADSGADAGAAPSGAAPAAPGAPAEGSTSSAPGLDSVPLEFSFSGSFFELADFFHRMKRFVRVANKDISVKGRLMTIDGLTFKSDRFPVITAEVRSTVYLSPKSQGATAGATPQGPSTDGATPAAAPGTTPAAPNTPVAQNESGEAR